MAALSAQSLNLKLQTELQDHHEELQREELQPAVLKLHSALLVQYDGLEHNIKALKSQCDQLLPLLQCKPRPHPSLPDPKPFSGRSYLYQTWLASITAKLSVDGGAIGDSKAQFYYVYFHLEDNVQAEVLERVQEAEKNKSWKYPTILEKLSQIYGTPGFKDGVNDLLHPFKTLEQGLDSVAEYTMKFQQAVTNTGLWWSNLEQRMAYYHGLNSHLRMEIDEYKPYPVEFQDFETYVHFVLDIENGCFVTANGSPANSNASNAGSIRSEPDRDLAESRPVADSRSGTDTGTYGVVFSSDIPEILNRIGKGKGRSG